MGAARSIFFLLALVLSLSARPPELSPTQELSPTMEGIDAAHAVQVWVEERPLPPGALPDPALFVPGEGSKAHGHLKKQAVWLRVEVRNPTGVPLSWALVNPRLNASVFDLYHLVDGTLAQASPGYDPYPRLLRPRTVFSATTPPGATSTLLIRVENRYSGFMDRAFALYSPDALTWWKEKHLLLQSFVSGGLFAIFLYNLFLLFSLRSQTYFWYSVYMAAVLVYAFSFNGFGNAFLWPGSLFLQQDMFGFAYMLSFAAAVQFSRSFLATRLRFPRIDRFLRFSILLFLLFAGVFLFFDTALAPVYGLGGVVLALLPLLGLYAWKKGYREARFYTLAWSMWTLGIAPVLYYAAGGEIPMETAVTCARIGMGLEATLLSFALADRINILRRQRDRDREKLEAQKEIIAWQSRMAQMGEMIAAIGHQWKQPLTVLGLISSDIQDELDDKGPDREKVIRQHMVQQEQVVEQMSQTIDDFREFFSPNKRLTRFSPLKTAENVLEMVGKQYKQERIRFQVEGDRSLTLHGPENEFKHVFINLFNNAMDAFREQKVKERQIRVRAVAEEEGSFTLEVADNAGGVPEKIRERLFEQYFTTKGEKGTGLGLHLCRQIVKESFGGEIRAENREGGLCFCMRFAAPQANDF